MNKSKLSAGDYVRSSMAIAVFFIIFLISTPFILLMLLLSFGRLTNFLIEHLAPVMMKPVFFTLGIAFSIKQHGPPRLWVNKVYLIFIPRARLRRFWLAAGDLFAGALLFFGPSVHFGLILPLFGLVAGVGTLFDHGLRLPYFLQPLLAALQLLRQRLVASGVLVGLLGGGQQLPDFLLQLIFEGEHPVPAHGFMFGSIRIDLGPVNRDIAEGDHIHLGGHEQDLGEQLADGLQEPASEVQIVSWSGCWLPATYRVGTDS